jgi:histidinol-phosphatase
VSEASPAFLDEALVVARRAAAAAAAVIERYYRCGVAVQNKADDSPVTIADIESETAIRAVLQQAYPEHAIYGEEQGFDRRDSDWLWLVDPIDGTKSFVRGYPMFSTQIALQYRGELVLGVSCAREYGQTAWARLGGGAWLDDVPIKVADTSNLEQAAISTGNLGSLARGPRWQALGELLQRVHRGRGYGDFLHYHLLAQGGIDAVIESDVNILDIAALSVIVREAGGIITDLDGRAPNLDTRSVLAATPALHPPLLQHFKGWH